VNGTTTFRSQKKSKIQFSILYFTIGMTSDEPQKFVSISILKFKNLMYNVFDIIVRYQYIGGILCTEVYYLPPSICILCLQLCYILYFYVIKSNKINIFFKIIMLHDCLLPKLIYYQHTSFQPILIVGHIVT